MRFNRSLVTAVAALALTAGAIFAHDMPDAAADGLATAMDAAGKVLPVGHVQEPADETADEPADETAERPAEEAVEAEDEDSADPEVVDDPADPQDEDDHCVTWDGTDPVVQEGEEPNHGAYVCGAARSATPEGFDTHGEWVSWVAHGNYRDDEATDETTDEATDEEADEAVEPEEDGDSHCLDWSDGVPVVEDGEEPNHGAYVCGAAQAEWDAEGFAESLGLDKEFRNRGEFMRWVAHRNYEDHDEDGDAESTVAVEEDADEARANGHGRGNGHENGRGNGRGNGHGRGRP